MIAMDPDRFGDANGWARHADGLSEEMTAQEGVRLPADRRYGIRQRTLKEGVTIPESLHTTIMEL